MQLGKPYILVELDKEDQQSKRERTTAGIFLHHKYIAMTRNLQFGKILGIGKWAKELFPSAEIGDTLIFKHIIEEQEWRLFEKRHDPTTDKVYEQRIVDIRSGTEVLAVLKHTGEWVINNNYVFFNKQYTLVVKNMPSSLLLVEAGTFVDDNYILNKIETLKLDRESLRETVEGATNPYDFEVKYNMMQSIANEQEELSRFLHSKKLCEIEIAHASDECKAMGIVPGAIAICDHKILYELDLELLGFKFFVTLTSMLDGILQPQLYV